jgi:hypothetical protein
LVVPKRLRFVDGEENIREMTRLALEAVGYEVGEGGSREWSMRRWQRPRERKLANEQAGFDH